MNVKDGFQYIEGDKILSDNMELSKLNIPKLERVEANFLSDNAQLTDLNLEYPEEKHSGRRR